MSLTLPELIELIGARYEPEEICEILEITAQDLLEIFSDKLEGKLHQFEDIESDIADYFSGYDDE